MPVLTNTNRVTLKKIAEEAGVTASTACKVINRRPIRVSSDTRQRIMTLAQQWGYQPDPVARSLKTNKTATIGLILGGLITPARVACIQRLEQLARERGYNILIGSSEGEGAIEALCIQDLMNRRVDGLVIASRGHDYDNEHLHELVASEIPSVLIEVRVPQIAIPQVVVDIQEGVRLLTSHFLSLDRNPVLMVMDSKNLSVVDRVLGFKQAFQEFQRRDAERHIFLMGRDRPLDSDILQKTLPQLGYDNCLRLLQERPETDGIIASNDHIALGVLRALNVLGKAVPGEILVGGFDGLPEAAFYNPPLTTVQYPHVTVAEKAMTIMNDLLEGKKPSQENMIIAPQLLIRDSTVRTQVKK